MVCKESDLFYSIPLYQKLPKAYQQLLFDRVCRFPFSFQQRKQLCDMAADLVAWEADSAFQSGLSLGSDTDRLNSKQKASFLFSRLEANWKKLQTEEKSYAGFEKEKPLFKKPDLEPVVPTGSILGRCPVASEKTRCCNLKTLDAVWQCGFDCSYCSIQSFYFGNRVRFVENLRERLNALELDANKRFHIGTGQSSDSLMWGNQNGLFEDLCCFAEKHPNIILEMKSKSHRVEWFLQNEVPPNMLFTWSLNTPTIIDAEERGTSSLSQRLSAARQIADRGMAVGFHFHPIVLYQDWKREYAQVVEKLTSLFKPQEVMTLSMGTLTFIRPVIKKVRSRMIKSKILQMPMEEIAGKLSYPLEQKKELFSFLYQLFPKEWHDSVFFYLCMEDPSLWKSCLGYEYSNNEEFEETMLNHYFNFVQCAVKKPLC